MGEATAQVTKEHALLKQLFHVNETSVPIPPEPGTVRGTRQELSLYL